MFSYIVISYGRHCSYQYGPFRDGMLHLILFDEMFFLEGLDSVNLPVVFFLGEDNFAVGACADNLHELEIINGERRIFNL
jgi:hypothetical protein